DWSSAPRWRDGSPRPRPCRSRGGRPVRPARRSSRTSCAHRADIRRPRSGRSRRRCRIPRPVLCRRMKRLLLLLLIGCATRPHVARSVDPREMTDLSTTGVALDLRYATTNNFMHTPLYPVAKAYLRAPVAAALADVERELAPQGLGLKVWDAYRPYRVTVTMWEPIKNPDNVGDPNTGSRSERV